MPHQCVRCSKMYDDGASEILQGCSCGARLFFYVRKDSLQKSKQVLDSMKQLSEPQKIEMEKDVFDLMGTDSPELPVILDLEAIRILEPGKFELDLIKLFKKDPLIFNIGAGKYVIDLPSAFKFTPDMPKKKKTGKSKKTKKSTKGSKRKK